MLGPEGPHVTVEGFDGPLDLLLELVEEKKLDILTVKLGDLADASVPSMRSQPMRSRRSSRSRRASCC